ncbi:hypothetical protein [Methylobacter sp.]|uniref:hypothetical protein n=1 Tax=Methylobacter sp. TaxID=2051955 RepID=UPI002FE30C5B
MKNVLNFRNELHYILDHADEMRDGYLSETFRIQTNNELCKYRTQHLTLATWNKIDSGEL